MMAQCGQLRNYPRAGNEGPKINNLKTEEYIKRFKDTSKDKMKEIEAKQMENQEWMVEMVYE
jgi:hypothetical protein